MTPDPIPALEAAAKAATPGPWAYAQVGEKCSALILGPCFDMTKPDSDPPALLSGRVDCEVYDERKRAYRRVAVFDELVCEGHDHAKQEDFAYIALANPATILALLERLATAERELALLKQFAEAAYEHLDTFGAMTPGLPEAASLEKCFRIYRAARAGGAL